MELNLNWALGKCLHVAVTCKHDHLVWQQIRLARKKLLMIHVVQNVSDLRVPLENRLEKIKGDRLGYYSIRINEQWRVNFKFEAGSTLNVYVEDYH